MEGVCHVDEENHRSEAEKAPKKPFSLLLIKDIRLSVIIIQSKKGFSRIIIGN